MKWLMFVLALLLSAQVQAQGRMYQWVDPATRTTQFSGVPPSWYRSGRPGPRVWVFQQGTLVDDTSLALPSERSDALRKTAFDEVSKRVELEALRRLEEAAEREAAAKVASEKSQPKKAPEKATQAEAKTEVATEESLSAAAIDFYKSIISAFDRGGGAANASAGPAR